MTNPVPPGHHTATPYLVIKGASQAIDFYKKVFNAQEMLRLEAPGGKIGHAEVKIGDSMIMLADEYPEAGFRGPRSLGGTPVSIALYVDDVDAWFKRATDAGVKVIKPVEDQFYGDRLGTFEDPFGHVWSVATHKEDMDDDELQRRFEEAMKQHGG